MEKRDICCEISQRDFSVLKCKFLLLLLLLNFLILSYSCYKYEKEKCDRVKNRKYIKRQREVVPLKLRYEVFIPTAGICVL